MDKMIQDASNIYRPIDPLLSTKHINNTNSNGNENQLSPQTYTFKYILVGDSAVGKTSLVSQFLNQEFNESNAHTIGVEFGTRQLTIGNASVLLTLWDTAGQERFRAVTRSYYRGSACAFLTFDITRRDTYNHIANWMADIRQNTSVNTQIVLIGNKLDLAQNRQVSYEEAQEFANQHNIEYVETSAKTSENVEELFLRSTRRILENIDSGIIDESNADESGIILPVQLAQYESANSSSGKCAC
jgi:small GTP-binding protein